MLYDKSMGGMRHTRTHIPMPQTQRWSLEAVRDVAAKSWSQHEASKPGVARLDPTTVAEEERKERVPQARRIYIRQNDLDKHEYANNCPKCQSIIVYGPNTQSSFPLSEVCRQRIMAEWAKTEAGQTRPRRAQERGDRYIAEKTQNALRDLPQRREAMTHLLLRAMHNGRYPLLLLSLRRFCRILSK